MKILIPGHRYQLDNHDNNHSASPIPGSKAEDCRNLCYEIEALPASEQQAKVSLAASRLCQRLLYDYQELQFIQKQKDESGVFKTVNDGTTNEEVLRVLIDRLSQMQAKVSCKENAVAITHIETALLWLAKRTADRKLRGVEGTPEK